MFKIKITQQNDDRLVFEEGIKNWVKLLLLLFTSFSVVVIFSVFNPFEWVKLEWIKLKCDRLEPTPKPQIECQRISSSLFSENIQTIPITESLQKAKVKNKKIDDSIQYSLFLLTSSREISLVNFGVSNKKDLEQKSNLINTFIQNKNQSTLVIKQSPNWFKVIFFMGWMTIALYGCILEPMLLIASSKSTKFIFDKEMGKMLIFNRITRSEKKLIQKSLNEIETAEIIETKNYSGDKFYQAVIKLNSGEYIEILPLSAIKQQTDQIVKAINKFLGIEPKK